MKGIIVGSWQWEIYEQALSDGFEANGIKIYKFDIYNTLKSNIQRKLRFGSQLNQLNQRLIQYAKQINPDFIFFQRPEYFYPSTIKTIKLLINTYLIGYHNDNPFIQPNKYLKYRLYFGVIKHFDLNYAYRPSNISDLQNFGSKCTKLLLPYYIEGLHNMDIAVEKEYDVTYIGHFENDGRDKHLQYLIDNNVNLKIFGETWQWKKSIINLNNISKPKHGIEYVKILKKSRIALALFSTSNKDIYTRRCFEIPASKTFMICQNNYYISKLFHIGKEVDVFSSKEELLYKVNYYLKESVLREKMMSKAYLEVFQKYSNIKTAKQIIDDIKQL
jgi:hypothetical protein